MTVAGAGPLARQSATDLAQLLETHQVSAAQLVDDFITEYDRINPLINAIVAIDPEGARLSAQRSDERASRSGRLSAIDGIPVTVKDNIFVHGFAASWGSQLYADFRPPCDDVAIGRLRAAGANLLAKTNTPEFSLGACTDNLLFGPTRNPWDLTLTPGGSSGGAVAALAAGIGALAVGTDSGGSIRRPASYTGVVGFRPSTGRIPRVFGFPPLAYDFQSISPAARNVDDVYLLFQIMAGPDTRDRASLCFKDYPLPAKLAPLDLKRLRIRCIFEVDGAPVDEEIRKQVESAAITLKELGHQVSTGEAPYSLEAIESICGILSTAGLAHAVTREHEWLEKIHPSSRTLIEQGSKVSIQEYLDAIKATSAFRICMATYFERTDFMLMPTSASPPWPLGEPYASHINGHKAGSRAGAIFAMFVNVAGLPAISLPVVPSARGLPIGMQLVGPFGSDVLLLKLAKEFEQAAPWADRTPILP